MRFQAGLTLLVILFLGSSAFAQGQNVDTTAIKEWLDEANVEINQGDLSSARKKIDQAMYWSEELNFQKGIERSKLRLGDFYLTSNLYDSAQVTLESAVNDYPESEFQIHYLNLLSTVYRYKNENEKAIESYRLALSKVDTLNDKRMIIAINQNMAGAYQNLGMKSEALERFMTSVEWSEAYKDTAILVVALNSLGNALNEFGEYDQAGFYLERSIALAKTKNLRVDILRATINMANVKSNLGQMEEALALYNNALELSKEVRPNTPPFLILYNIGNTYLKMGRLSEAKYNFEESLKYCNQFSIPQGIYYNSIGLGNVAEKQNNFTSAMKWYNEASEIAEGSGISQFQTESLESLYRVSKQLELYGTALNYFERYTALSDSLNDLEKEKEFTELKNQLELKRQTEINLLLQEKQAQQETQLQFQLILIIAAVFIIILILIILRNSRRSNRAMSEANVQLQEQRAELEKLNGEMNKLFAIIAHDLRAPLSSLKGMLYLVKEGELDQDEITEFSEELETSLQRNIEVMEDLFSWAKDQLSGITLTKEQVHVHELVEKVISKQEHRAIKKNITLVNEIEVDCILDSDPNALTLVFRNLLSNAIKFTDTGDAVRFSSKKTGKGIEICVIDTGIGMTDDVLERVFSNTSISFSKDGTQGEKGTGFGLSIVKEFVNKLGGEIRVESKEGQGTKFCIRFPKV